jgi:hypothetical protein
MHWTLQSTSQSKDTNPLGGQALRGLMIAALLILIVATIPAQSQDGSSLADLARQARAQKQAQSGTEPNRAREVANELSEDQNDGGAPGGFKAYNQGDYKVWVPAPFKVEGHDDAGIVLSGPMVGSKRPMVLVGTPVVDRWAHDDAAFDEAATQFAHLYAQSSNCSKTTIANHEAYQCSLAAANLLSQQVSGNAVFVRASGYMYPMLCVAPTESQARDTLNNARSNSAAKGWARQSLDHEEDGVRNVWKKCESVFQSIHIKEGAAPENAPAAAAPPAASSDSGKTAAAALQHSTVPAGFKVQAFNYCKSHTQCWDASVLVPAEAKLVSSDCKQYVFEMKVQGSPFLLLMGPAGESCDGRKTNDPSLVRWKQLVDPETARDPGTSSLVGSQQMTLDGKPAFISQMRFKNGVVSWISKRADIETNGSQIVVGCLAPTDTFADGDSICSRLIDSLRLP